MMVSAQRVAKDRLVQGINSFVYEDAAAARSGASAEALLMGDPGRFVFRAYEVAPGGNSVRSFLDVALPGRVRASDAEWFFNTLPRWVNGTRFPVQGTLGRGAFRFGIELGLTPRWHAELIDLCGHAQRCLMSYLSTTAAPGLRPIGLSEVENGILAEAASRGDTAACLDFVRGLARTARIEDISSAITSYAQGCEVNRTPVRAFLAAQLPGIFANHYFPLLGTASFSRFIDWGLSNPDWGELLQRAALDSGEALRREVDQVVASFTA